MKINDTNGKQHEVKDIKIVSYPITSAIDEEDLGTMEYVEYTVIGHNSEWIDWMELEKFKELNPGVDI